MVHPNVLKNCGIDPEEYSGFAFGFGVERIAMAKFGIEDMNHIIIKIITKIMIMLDRRKNESKY